MSPWYRPVSAYAEGQLAQFLYADGQGSELFTGPEGESALVPGGGLVSEIYSNPLTLYIGGITAVLMELAEPRVRHGVWDHSVFPTDPALRLRRTALAAMVSIHSAQSISMQMIDGINRRHDAVEGVTSCGKTYRASDPELLKWVHGTAAYGFIGAYDRYLRQLSPEEWDSILDQVAVVAEAYRVEEPPRTNGDLYRLIGVMWSKLEPSETLATFLELMRTTPALPPMARGFQPMFIRAAISLLPERVRDVIGLSREGLRPGEEAIVRFMVWGAGLLQLSNHPKALADERLSITRGVR
ncbi:MAG: oxygenase MpaB family protein [Pseudomonadota bacterium]